ncbi:MAG: AMP-binding protein [Synergistaceae bacterium]|jgi:acyl-[acyl-carrier-protein]-phospholipid O-acyltransferase/long-chain-fatty-acid--[acyl-carrier-protein] ligase|nr:AMP-binding protein [Synergistaceae bacterium]
MILRQVTVLGKFLAKLLFRALYRPEIKLDTLSKALEAGERVVLAPHHASYIDPLLFALFSPREPLAVISPSMARQKWFKFFKSSFNHAVVDLNDPMAAKHINDLWKKSNFLMVFPEPEPTTSGILMKIADAAVSAIERSGAWVVPARACNTQFTPFSRMEGRLVRVTAPKVVMLSGEAVKFGVDGEGGGKYSAKRAVESMLNDVMALGLWDKKPLFDTLLEQRKLWGARRVMAIEPNGARTDWNRFLTLVFVMRRIALGLAGKDGRIGIMMPNSVAALAAIIGIQRADMEPAMINYSMGPRPLRDACAIANVGVIITSRRFVEEGKFQPLLDAVSSEGMVIKYIEDLVGELSAFQKLGAAISARFARPTPDPEKYAERTALVLFTSGSEGTPKAVALSFLNIQANTAQVRTTLDFCGTDVMVDIMPMFHSFGLCTGTIMPLSTGMPVALYPTPLHYKKIPQFSYEAKGTVLLGTNAFLYGYARNAEPFDFFEMRYVICGGDKLRDATSELWFEKFGIQVLEGYGVTECTPVVGVNRKGRNNPGSIGLPLPCVKTSIVPVDGVAEGGRLVVRGPNVMKGYIKADGSIVPPPDEGYDTGDIVTADDDGFVTIIGRAKRFAKIGGEMISLAYIEEAVQEVWPDEAHAVVSISGDDNKGEVIVLLTERKDADREILRAALAENGLSEIAIPRKIIVAEALPRIGVGKIDYQSAAKIAAGNDQA